MPKQLKFSVARKACFAHQRLTQKQKKKKDKYNKAKHKLCKTSTSPSFLLKQANKASNLPHGSLSYQFPLALHLIYISWICYIHKNKQILCTAYLHTTVIFLFPSFCPDDRLWVSKDNLQAEADSNCPYSFEGLKEKSSCHPRSQQRYLHLSDNHIKLSEC